MAFKDFNKGTLLICDMVLNLQFVGMKEYKLNKQQETRKSGIGSGADFQSAIS